MFAGKPGVYTRKRGLDKETNKALLLKHITDNKQSGSPMKDFLEVLPSHSRRQIQRMLETLKAEGKIELRGKTKAVLWFPKQNTSKKELHR